MYRNIAKKKRKREDEKRDIWRIIDERERETEKERKNDMCSMYVSAVFCEAACICFMYVYTWH